MKIAHLSTSKRSDGDFTGVPKFAWYFQRAMQFKGVECDILVPNEKDLNQYDVIVGDGYFAPNPLHKDQIVISVVHGTWAEWATRNNCVDAFKFEILRQKNTWNNPNIKVVCCSEQDMHYLPLHYGRTADKLILHGVDTELFKPCPEKIERGLILHTATNTCKSAHGLLDRVGNTLKKHGYRFDAANVWDGKEHERYQQAELYFNPSFHEGNSYACLEFMSLGTPMVVSDTGLFYNIQDMYYRNRVAEILAWKSTEEQYVSVILSALAGKDTYNPRRWVLQNATFEIFADNWYNYIGSLLW